MRKSPVAAITVSDIHWSLRPPIIRSVEKNWLKTQKGYVDQLRELQKEHNMAPILIAGDLFDRWDPPLYLVNQVLNWLQGMAVWVIPGNHDTPLHNHSDLNKSAYWTLTEAHAVHHLTPGFTHSIGNLVVHPFPYGVKILPPNRGGNDLVLHVALIHDYIWTKTASHDGYKELDKRYRHWVKRLDGYDIAIFGDNHIGFMGEQEDNGVTIVNNGTFMRRTFKDLNYKPRVSLIHTGGKVSKHYLDTSRDEVLEVKSELESVEHLLDLSLAGFAEDLMGLKARKIDFAKAVMNWLERQEKEGKISEGVKSVMLRAIGIMNMES